MFRLLANEQLCNSLFLSNSTITLFVNSRRVIQLQSPYFIAVVKNALAVPYRSKNIFCLYYTGECYVHGQICLCTFIFSFSVNCDSLKCSG